MAFAFLLAAVFFAAWTASLAGLAPIIGAFLAGIALNRLIPKQSPLMTRLEFVGNAFLVPFFLVSVGLLVDVRVLGSAEVWGLALLFAAIVFVGKVAAALLGVPLFGFTRNEALSVAGLTVPQAAATLAVTLIGFEIGLFSQTAVNAVVLLIVLTCLVGPSVVQVFGRPAGARRGRAALRAGRGARADPGPALQPRDGRAADGAGPAPPEPRQRGAGLPHRRRARRPRRGRARGRGRARHGAGRAPRDGRQRAGRPRRSGSTRTPSSASSAARASSGPPRSSPAGTASGRAERWCSGA